MAQVARIIARRENVVSLDFRKPNMMFDFPPPKASTPLAAGKPQNLLKEREHIHSQATADAVQRVGLTKAWVIERLMENAEGDAGAGDQSSRWERYRRISL